MDALATESSLAESPPSEPLPSHSEAYAPGRVCVLGEHCDWAQVGACLVAPLGRGVTVRAAVAHAGLRVRSDFGRSLLAPDGRAVPEDPNRYVAATIRVLLEEGAPLPPVRVAVESDLPPGRGFSSSAAVCVASADALLQLVGVKASPARLAALATRAEQEQLNLNIGRMDPLACAHGEPLLIEWGPPERLTVLKELSLPLLSAAFPTERAAGPILDALGEAWAAGHGPTRRAIMSWGEAAAIGASAIRLGKLEVLGEQMNRAQAAYEAIGLPELAAPALSEACAALRAAGALGAKFSGAGGDGSLVALFADEAGLAAGRRLLEARGLEVL